MVNLSVNQKTGLKCIKKQEIMDLLVAFCHEPHTLQEIASHLGFSDRYRMKRVYIDPILGDLLEMTSMETKNDPTQKYVTIINKDLL